MVDRWRGRGLDGLALGASRPASEEYCVVDHLMLLRETWEGG